jgi:hypothetical protein
VAANLSAKETHKILVNDFQNLWNVMARSKTSKSRGNFAFALLAMAFLEFTSRLCASDTTGAALKDFSDALNRIESRYFNKIDGLKAPVKGVELPHVLEKSDDLVICALFDLRAYPKSQYFSPI